MIAQQISTFVSGAIAMGYAVISIFFLRFWKTTADKLFLAFAGAFFLLACGQAATVLLQIPRENLAPIYLVRLVAFSLIILAVVTKNLSDRRS